MRRVLTTIKKLLGSFGLTCALLLCLFLLVWLGTLAQVEDGIHAVQRRFFESWMVHVRLGPMPLVLPGGLLCMGLFAVNLVVGGLIRIRKTRRTAGVIVSHVGILMLLVGGFVEFTSADYGSMMLWPNDTKAEYESYTRWEVAVWDASERTDVFELVIPQEDFEGLVGNRERAFVRDRLPFELVLGGFQPNSRPEAVQPIDRPEAPVVESWTLVPLNLEKEAEQNIAGIYVRAHDSTSGASHAGLLWGLEMTPWTFEAGGRTWAVTLRHETFDLPFAIRLAAFTKEDHPGMQRPRVFASDVVKVEDGLEQALKIEMNRPLRHAGYVVYQASWGPPEARPEDEKYSVLAVSRNPTDQWPKYACYVIAAGLLLAFGERLLATIRQQRRRLDREA